MPTNAEVVEMIEQSYNVYGGSRATPIGSWQPIYESEDLVCYKRGAEVVFALRGTQDFRDVGADVLIGLGLTTLRLMQAKEEVMAVLSKLGGYSRLFFVGHSLGGYLAYELFKSYASDPRAYFIGVNPYIVRGWNSYGGHATIIRTEVDAVSKLTEGEHGVKTFESATKDLLEEHGLQGVKEALNTIGIQGNTSSLLDKLGDVKESLDQTAAGLSIPGYDWLIQWMNSIQLDE